MNILSVGGRYKPTNGGNAKRISTMCEAFCRQGNSVTVMTCDGYAAEHQSEMIHEVAIYRYPDYRKLTEQISAVAKDKHIDIILVHEETYLRRIVSLRIDIPVVYECHAIEPNQSRWKEFVLGMLRRFYINPQRVKRVFVLSNSAKDRFSKKYAYPEDCIVYTPNGVNRKDMQCFDMHFGNKEHFVYGYAGTLYEFQGILNILKYAKDILAIAPDVKLMIVGGGPLEAEVRAYIMEHNLEDRVIATGTVAQTEFDKLLHTFDVMLLPRPSTLSTESAVPLKVFDAAIHKKPVVMSNVSGLTEAFSGDAALIYDTKTPDDFVDCCKVIYRNCELAQQLVRAEQKSLEKWPTVDEVAQLQLASMLEVIGECK